MKKLVFILIIVIYSISFSITGNRRTGNVISFTPEKDTKFSGITKIEKEIFGFISFNSGLNFEERLGIAEEKVFGDKSNENILVRQRKLHDLIYLDGSFYSLLTKIDNLENYLFQERRRYYDILTRLEKIEEYIYGYRLNRDSITNRVSSLYEYLLLEDKNFIKKGKFLKKDIGIIELKAVKNYGNLRVDDVVEFNLEKTIDGIAESGSIVVGKVLKRSKQGMFGDEKVIIILRKIITANKREIGIYKKLEIKGNVQNFIFGKKVRIDKILIIG